LANDQRRKVYCVLSARSLSYSEACLKSLFRNAIEPLDVVLITDDAQDKTQLLAVKDMDPEGRHIWSVMDKAEVDVLAEAQLADHPAVRQFREGHPCWRKVTDPVLVAKPGEEIIILDPDVYFPNPFTFEPAPANGIYLMWQAPNCLLPEDTVRAAFDSGVVMADHTDIGVAQLGGTLDWAHLNTLIVKLGGADLPWSMHVESIVWAELAMAMGGGYLDPRAWHCFANDVSGRISRKLGKTGVATLASLDVAGMKCMHAGGIAKNWLVDAEKIGVFASHNRQDRPTSIKPFETFPREKFERKFKLRRLAEKIGLYKILGG
jgi:hypothetical protein